MTKYCLHKTNAIPVKESHLQIKITFLLAESDFEKIMIKKEVIR